MNALVAYHGAQPIPYGRTEVVDDSAFILTQIAQYLLKRTGTIPTKEDLMYVANLPILSMDDYMKHFCFTGDPNNPAYDCTTYNFYAKFYNQYGTLLNIRLHYLYVNGCDSTWDAHVGFLTFQLYANILLHYQILPTVECVHAIRTVPNFWNAVNMLTRSPDSLLCVTSEDITCISCLGWTAFRPTANWLIANAIHVTSVNVGLGHRLGHNFLPAARCLIANAIPVNSDNVALKDRLGDKFLPAVLWLKANGCNHRDASNIEYVAKITPGIATQHRRTLIQHGFSATLDNIEIVKERMKSSSSYNFSALLALLPPNVVILNEMDSWLTLFNEFVEACKEHNAPIHSTLYETWLEFNEQGLQKLFFDACQALVLYKIPATLANLRKVANDIGLERFVVNAEKIRENGVTPKIESGEDAVECLEGAFSPLSIETKPPTE
ncbi:MAG: hypothetical protein ABW189_09070 [Rickettsiales bacterium]